MATWDWATSTDITTGVAVLPNGSLVISSDRYNNDAGIGGDGYLHVIPPWGGTLSPANRFGPIVDMIDVVYRQGSLYGLSYPDDNVTQPSFPIVRIDATTGAKLATLGPYTNVPGHLLALDPLTQRLVMPHFDPGGTELIEVDPQTGATSHFIDVPLDPDEVAFSSDGSVVWTGFEPAGINAYDRNGTLLYTIPNTSSTGGIVVGRAGTCMQDKLFLTDDDANVYYVDHPSATSRTTVPLVVRSSGGSGWGRMTADSAGHLVVSNYGAYLVACPGFVPPTKPAPPKAGNQPAPAGRHQGHSQGGTGNSLNLPQPPGPQTAPQPLAQPQPGVSAQTGSVPASVPSAVHGVAANSSTAAAPNAMVGDVPEDRPVLGFSALLDPTRGPALLLVLACGAGAVAWAACRSASLDVARRWCRPRDSNPHGVSPNGF